MTLPPARSRCKRIPNPLPEQPQEVRYIAASRRGDGFDARAGTRRVAGAAMDACSQRSVIRQGMLSTPYAGSPA